MRDQELYATILGVEKPWRVTQVELNAQDKTVVVHIEHDRSERYRCSQCGAQASGYDHRKRRWRHLDTCQYKTELEVNVPRVQCAEHGVAQLNVPWAERGSQFTLLMERMVIDWLQEASIAAVAELLRLSWDEVDGVMQRAVARGLERREAEPLGPIGIDETSYQKRHRYVTLVNDLKRSRVLYAHKERGRAAIDGFFTGLSEEQLAAISSIAMDMWPAYIASARAHVPDANDKIAFDRFHVAQYLSKAVDQVRRAEHRELCEQDNDILKKSRYLWLSSPERLQKFSEERRLQFETIQASALKTSYAWSFKETARELWNAPSREAATHNWQRWVAWAQQSFLPPIIKVANMIGEHLWGIVNAVVLRTTNAGSESINARIQQIKKMACGFRNQDRFIRAIYFHCGDLDLHPSAVVTHTTS